MFSLKMCTVRYLDRLFGERERERDLDLERDRDLDRDLLL